MITLYSTGCPKCNVLKRKLSEKNIAYEEVNDTDLMLSKGFDTIPILDIDGRQLDFNAAISWICEQKGV